MTSITDKLTTDWNFIWGLASSDLLSFILFIVAALCLNEWAIIHYMANIAITGGGWVGNVGFPMSNIFAAGIDYSQFEYPIHTSRVLVQHGGNLGMGGLFSHYAILAMIQNSDQAPMIAMVPFIVDIWYFIAVDVPHLGKGNPVAEAQTYIISVGLICTALFTYLNSSKGSWDLMNMIPFVTAGTGLILAGLVNLFVNYVLGGWGSPVIMDGSTDYAQYL